MSAWPFRPVRGFRERVTQTPSAWGRSPRRLLSLSPFSLFVGLAQVEPRHARRAALGWFPLCHDGHNRYVVVSALADVVRGLKIVRDRVAQSASADPFEWVNDRLVRLEPARPLEELQR